MHLLTKIFLVIILLCSANTAWAAPSVEISVNPLFEYGETIEFQYTILSQQTENITYLERVNCLTSLTELLPSPIELTLIQNRPVSSKYTYGTVNENTQGRKCTASIIILEPYNLEIKKEFEVKILNELSISPVVCKEPCSENTKIFKTGDKIKLDYISSSDDIIIKGILTLPDSTIKQITFPSSINADQIGTYTLEIMATKENYKDVYINEQFGVIESDVEIGYTYFNEDILTDEHQEKENSKIAKCLVYIIILAAILSIILFIRKKHKQNRLKFQQ